MMRSMFAGVSGLRNHQIRMDVIGNNIANVNTMGFKASRVSFQEVFNQTIRGASAPYGLRGGTNPQQVGLGMTVASIDTFQVQGNLQLTGKMTDLAIQGNGFFIMNEDGKRVYTRSGNFDLDSEGYLINPGNGMRVQGWTADNTGALPVRDENHLSDIRIPVGQPIAALATDDFSYSGNLDASVPVGTTWATSVDIFDGKGQVHPLSITFTKVANNVWDYTIGAPEAGIPDPTVTATAGAFATDPTWPVLAANQGRIVFSADGSFDAASNPTEVTIDLDLSSIGTADISTTIQLSDLTQYASKSTASAASRNGYPMGALETFTIDASGTITGVYSNGLTQTIGQVGLANFSNPAGLLKKGDNVYVESNNSGLKQIGEPGTAGRGVIAPGSLEMSNVDLSQEFTNMIITQRGFQANSRIITTSDEMLQELVNLKR
ncbi:MAG: flagellar hook protein FlgE [Chloroflexota bacterium]